MLYQMYQVPVPATETITVLHLIILPQILLLISLMMGFSNHIKSPFLALCSMLGLNPDSLLLPLCVFHQPRCSLYLACFHLGLLLAALPTLRLELGEAELPKQVTGAAQQVAGEAQLPASLRRQLGTICRQLERGRRR